MRILSITEFEDWCRAKAPTQFIYASSNQESVGCVRVSLRFDRVIVCPEIRQIWFGCGHGGEKSSVFVNSVKEIHMHDDVKRVGTVFDIVCAPVKEFRMIAD